MKINTAPQNEAIVSNVGEIGEFRIRNSAKAFNILSSGLYANKIRAIIRELSCNAVDSHVAAGRKDTPFDVHLPNSLEPWFSIRDYGTGLNHEQVTNIYTTYFESTKTDSNDYIGALGLGSKSPFSYTDNFTVTAIKDGKRGIYTAFINEYGVPSIALMMQEDTDEPSGVEVKFSVNERWDFDKFRSEARTVYKHFTLHPVISGVSEWKFESPTYERKDILPGIHHCGRQNFSFAVMGNIAYPIEIPQADKTLGNLSHLLSCGLELHFEIGELDFQASREGLSYIPQTVLAIKSKLEQLNASLTAILTKEAEAIENLWERALFLSSKRTNSLWNASVIEYSANAKLPTYDASQYNCLTKWTISLDDLIAMNISLKGIQRSRSSKSITTLKPLIQHSVNSNGDRETIHNWEFYVDATSHFVLSDLKIGVSERVKYHYRNTDCNVYSRNVYILEPVNRNKPMDTKAFFDRISNPPESRIFKASTLTEKPRKAGMGKNVSIMKLEQRGGNRYSFRSRDDDMVWRNAGAFGDFDNSRTYYYVPLSGFNMESTKGYASGKQLYEDVSSLPGLFNGILYGVRKSDIEAIKQEKNWINIEEHVSSVFEKTPIESILIKLVKSKVDNCDIVNYNNTDIVPLISANSPYAKLLDNLNKIKDGVNYDHHVNRLLNKFAPGAVDSLAALAVKYQADIEGVYSRYPLLKQLSTYRANAHDIAEYINLIDQKKGI